MVNKRFNQLKKVFGVGALVLTLATGCENKPEYVAGIVTQERGNVARVIESSGAIFGNESVKINDPTYILQIQFPQGLYTASIRESISKPLVALALAIEEGSQIKIDKKYFEGKYTNRFEKDKIGYLWSNEIIVESKE